jgi:flagellin
MGLRINTNVAALIGQRNIERTDRALSTALERLSSGLRINRAADDPAGLAVAERQRAQIAGLNQAIENAERATSLVQTAEASLDEVNSILVHMRELAIDSANVGVNDANALAANQAEIDNALDTLDRIARDTQFGTKNLLDGSAANSVTLSDGTNDTIYASFSNSTLATGTRSLKLTAQTDAYWTWENETTMEAMGIFDKTDGLSNDGQDVKGLTAGAHTIKVTQASAASSIEAAANLDAMGAAEYFKLTIGKGDGTNYAETELTIADKDYSALAVSDLVTDINALIEANGVIGLTGGAVAKVEAYDAGGGSIGFRTTGQGSDSYVKITAGTTGADAIAAGGVLAGFTDADDSNTATIGTAGIDAIVELDGYANTVSYVEGDDSLAGTTVTLSDGDVAQLKFMAQNDVEIEGYTSRGLNLGTMVATVTAAAGTATIYTEADGAGTNGAAVNWTADSAFSISDYAGQSVGVTIDNQILLDAGPGAGTATENLTIVDNSLVFQVGGGRNQTVSLSLLDVGSNTLAENVTNVSAFANLSEISVLTSQGCSDALLLIDQAIAEVTDVRASIGSFQSNTLDSQISNLRMASENMTAARSTLVDADFAQEVSEFTKQQILLQAGMSILSSAGQLPQLVLSLLR